MSSPVSYAAQQIAKSRTAQWLLLSVVVVRYTDIVTDLVLLMRYWNDENWVKFWIQALILGALAVVSSVVAFFRQRDFERKHDPNSSAFLGLVQLQLFIELKDSIEDGKKTACLKTLLYYGSLQSVLSILFQSFIGWNEYLWDWLLFISVFASLANLAITLVSFEKEVYFLRGLGKLPTFSVYSIVLTIFRMMELPARFLSMTLFAAEFEWFVILLVAGDAGLLLLIRHSTHTRIRVKKEAAKRKLARSLQALNKSVEDLDRLEQVLDDDPTGVEEMDTFSLSLHVPIWIFTYVEGLDVIPYILLRLVEEAVVAAFFIILRRDDLDDKYQTWMLIWLLLFVILHLFCAAFWAYFRSHAEFFETRKGKEDIRMHVLNSVKQGEKEIQPSTEESVSDSDFADLEPMARRDHQQAMGAVPKLQLPAAQAAQEEPEEEEEEESSHSLSSHDEAFDLPNNVLTEVVVKEVPVQVAAPPGNMRTQGVQYDFKDLNQTSSEQDLNTTDTTATGDHETPMETPTGPPDQRGCRAPASVASVTPGKQTDEQCAVM